MMWRRRLSIGSGERGISLIELLIAVVITGLIGVTVATATNQLSVTSRKARSQTSVNTELQQVAYFMQIDAKMAQEVEPDPGATGFPLVLSWVDWQNSEHEVTYRIEGNQLIRTYLVDGGTQAHHVLADCIESGTTMTTCQYIDNTLYIEITGSSGSGKTGATQTRRYQIQPRATE